MLTKDVKYQKVSDFECSKCPDPALNAIRVIGVGLAVFVFFMIIIVINVRKIKESEVSVLLKIMTNYLQLITTTMSFSTKFPGNVTSMFSVFEEVGGASDTFLSFDCFVMDNNIKGPFPSNTLFKIFMAALLPLILTLIVFAVWLMVYLLARKY